MRTVKPKQDEYMLGSTSSKPSSVKKSPPIYPKFRLDLDTVPEAKDWKVGKTYKIEMEVKMVGLSISRFDNSAEFEIRKIGSEDAGSTDEPADEGGDDEE